MGCENMQPWEESAVSNGYKFVIAIGQELYGEFEIIAVSKNVATSERIIEDYAVDMNGVIVMCDIQTQRIIKVMHCGKVKA